jgi:hypothetical protein
MSNDFIDYGKLIDDAMHIIVRNALQRVSKEGLPGKHHFFISFLTSYPGVVLSDTLRKKYPEEMTIVLQHQFESLKVTDKRFDVVLSFDNVKENIGTPFDALLAFADPSVKFGLQFRQVEEIYEDDFSELEEIKGIIEKDFASDLDEGGKSDKPKAKGGKSTKKAANVVDMDSFRKK